jgi:hypothetical protein
MAEIPENQRVDEEFHEETPQEFAAEPDRSFSKAPTTGSDEPSDEPEGDADKEARRGGAATGDE